MKAKKGAYVKKNISENGNKKKPATEITINDQLDLLADIITEQYLNSLYEQTNNTEE